MKHTLMSSVLVLILVFFSEAYQGQTISFPSIIVNPSPSGSGYTTAPFSASVAAPIAPAPISLATLNGLGLTYLYAEFKSGVYDVGCFNASGVFSLQKVQLTRGQVLGWGEFTRPSLSLMSVPFKIRGTMDNTPLRVQSGLTNVGISYNILGYRIKRFFGNGGSSTHTFNAGVFLAPSVEEINSETSKTRSETKSSQLFMSTGISISYSYGDASFVLIPIGFDFGTAAAGNDFLYNGKPWWGFGLGLSMKVLGLQ